MTAPTEGEIRLVTLDPTVGAEMSKARPAVVLTNPALDGVPLRLVVPVTTWQERFRTQPLKVRILASHSSGLDRLSAADVIQVRTVSLKRFPRKLGVVDHEVLAELRAGVATVAAYRA